MPLLSSASEVEEPGSFQICEKWQTILLNWVKYHSNLLLWEIL